MSSHQLFLTVEYVSKIDDRPKYKQEQRVSRDLMKYHGMICFEIVLNEKWYLDFAIVQVKCFADIQRV